MPSAPPRICPRCRGKITGPRCTTCHQPWQGSAWTGGSTRRWRKVRAEQLARHPICQAPNCTHLAREVDHIKNRTAGGYLYDPANLQSLCTPHHDEKTKAEAQAAR
ncbi:HNH endonuclease signature motif containing protein [Rhodococcus sp. G-MC3]|uniref:HNH endonuclease signature motif containing protein n=1 Tax=Rhodococcus sp. G-MC3 TaxID=3046209 RepID=UPI0024BB7CB3|nr:HNH endonuclease signature motif containing protein [Rhodococcus sp. G-MC3]MDJ0394250.1 HNH endonuclease signature motif containing protein [Rhodococcus sp. G-MC3]